MPISLLVSFNGDDASTTATDRSASPKTLTFSGSAQLSTARSKFGGASLRVNDASSGVAIPTSEQFNLGTGDFTIATWVYVESFSPAMQGIFNIGLFSGGCLARVRSGGIELYISGTQYDFPASFPTGAWTHVEFSRVGGVLHGFLNGVLLASVAAPGSIPAGAVTIGRGAHINSEYLNGYMDELILAKGEGFHVSTFAVPGAEYHYGAVAANGPSPTVEGFGGGFVDATPPSPLLLSAPMGSGSAALAGPSPSLQSYCGGAVTATAPAGRLTAQARLSVGDYAANLSAPSPTLHVTTGASARRLTAPKQTLEASATGTNWGVADVSAPAGELASSGTVAGMGRAELSPAVAGLIGYSGAVCSVTLTGRAQLQAQGTTGATGAAQVTAPLFKLTAIGTQENYGSASLLAPSPKLGGQAQAWVIAPAGRLEAIGTATVAVTYEAYATNLNHTPRRGVLDVDEMTRYTNFPFTHVVRYRGSYFGANSTGLYLLEGTTDDGEPITYDLQTCPDDFGHTAKKTAASVFLSGRIDPDLTATVLAGQDAPQSYKYQSPRGATAQTHRVKFGRGIKDRYLAVGLAGNGELELDELDLEISNLTRRT